MCSQDLSEPHESCYMAYHKAQYLDVGPPFHTFYYYFSFINFLIVTQLPFIRCYSFSFTFKLCLLVLKCLHGLPPQYLAELCHWPPQSALCRSRTTEFSSVQHEKLWSTSVLVRRPSRLELTAGTLATNYIDWYFQALSENVLIRAVVVFSALKTFCLTLNWLYKFPLLTYLFTSSL